MKESVVESRLQRRCRDLGIYCIKGEPLGKGWPDRIILGAPARIAFIELKRPGVLDARRRQRLIHAMLRSLGFTVRVLHTPELVDEFMDEFEDTLEPPRGKVEDWQDAV